MHKRQLVLEDGTVFIGDHFGSDVIKYGEVIFNVNMTGYQEMITDPANFNQIIVSTYPVIGSYGINSDDSEAIEPSISGLVVKEINDFPSNFKSEESLSNYLEAYNIPGISGIDTRELIKMLRNKGTLRGAIASMELAPDVIINRLKNNHPTDDEVSHTSITKPYIVPGSGKRIVVINLGMKQSVLKELAKRDCHVTVVPYDYTVEQIKRFNPEGIIVSNGPGSPFALEETISTIKKIIGETAFLGIGLGHQLFALANELEVERTKYGNHNSGYPVKQLESEVSYLTNQNTHYIVNRESVNESNLKVTYVGLNDQTVQGLTIAGEKAMSVQFNPEGSPGTNEASFVYDDFLNSIRDN